MGLEVVFALNNCICLFKQPCVNYTSLCPDTIWFFFWRTSVVLWENNRYSHGIKPFKKLFLLFVTNSFSVSSVSPTPLHTSECANLAQTRRSLFSWFAWLHAKFVASVFLFSFGRNCSHDALRSTVEIDVMDKPI